MPNIHILEKIAKFFEKNTLDYYLEDSYNCYKKRGGSFYIINNDISINNLTFLLLVDSYNEVVSPFLSLMCKKLIVVSPRGFNGSIKAVANLYKPNLVLIAYTSRTPPESKDDLDYSLWQFE